jgi:hypothetical protein
MRSLHRIGTIEQGPFGGDGNILNRVSLLGSIFTRAQQYNRKCDEEEFFHGGSTNLQGSKIVEKCNHIKTSLDRIFK